ncbi:LysR family transcriptional regulator [Frankia tisae]|uniref:LysR family transcriptional regulator n=1 Tax=Frankia tisae TaxID=2950104 RepID=UPI0021C01629|nr:LysR family transcriptional regulator [Frankia tisae]
MLDLRRVMLLCDLADLGTVTAVAKRRNITSSAVSQQLRVLESEVGVILFRRDGRTLGLTPAGDVLVEHVRRVVSALDEAMSAVAATRDRVAGSVSIASFNMGIPMLAAPVVSRLVRDEADLQLAIQQATAERALRMLRRGELDVAITCRYHFGEQPSLSGLTEERLLDEPLVLLAPSEHHTRVRTSGLVALADIPFVTGAPDSGLGGALQRAADAAGFIPKVKHRVDGARNICELAATEVALAIAPRMAVPVHLEGLIVEDIDFGVREISAVVREGRQRDPNIRLVLRELHKVVEETWPESGRTPLSVAVRRPAAYEAGGAPGWGSVAAAASIPRSRFHPAALNEARSRAGVDMQDKFL